MNGRRVSALCFGLTLLVAATAAVFLVLGPGRPLPNDLFGGVAGGAFLALALAYGTVGAVVAFRVPGNRIGWLFSLIALLSALNGLTYSYAEYGIYAVEQPLAREAALVWSSLELVAPLLGLSLLLLPDGRLPSRLRRRCCSRRRCFRSRACSCRGRWRTHSAASPTRSALREPATPWRRSTLGHGPSRGWQ